MNRVRRLFERPSRVFVFLIAISCLTPGCGVKPASPEAARKALKTVLDGWKGGQTQEDLKKKSSIHTNEAYWTNGYKLLDYEIAPEEETVGFNLRFIVKLYLADTEGNNVEEEATYSVGTSPQLVVVRSGEM